MIHMVVNLNPKLLSWHLPFLGLQLPMIRTDWITTYLRVTSNKSICQTNKCNDVDMSFTSWKWVKGHRKWEGKETLRWFLGQTPCSTFIYLITNVLSGPKQIKAFPYCLSLTTRSQTAASLRMCSLCEEKSANVQADWNGPERRHMGTCT